MLKSMTAHHSPQTFVFIFRQGAGLSDDDRRRRAEETSAWARIHNQRGHHLEPRILEPEVALRGTAHSATIGGDAAPITALLFVQAADIGEAALIAESHPGVKYGASVEIRRWAPPAPVSSDAVERAPK